ncbi:MAG: cyclic nucleotide-binding domain-containing protein [Roseobacter sp.]
MIVIMSAAKFFTQLERACKTDQSASLELNKGQTLFRQNDAPPGLPLLMKGQIDLVRWTEAGRSIRIHVACEGETFAEASLFSETCHCDAVAIVPSGCIRAATQGRSKGL